MSDFAGRTAVITGAMGGAGRAIALALAALKVHLCLIGRREKMLDAIAADARDFNIKVKCVLADLRARLSLLIQAPAQQGDR